MTDKEALPIPEWHNRKTICCPSCGVNFSRPEVSDEELAVTIDHHVRNNYPMINALELAHKVKELLGC